MPGKWALIFAAIVVAIAILISWRAPSGAQNATGLPAQAEVVEYATHPNSAISAQAAARAVAKSPGAEPRTDTTCLTEAQAWGHPSLAQDIYRFESVAVIGPVFTSYEGLTLDELNDLVVQGDTAAMVVAGAMFLMRAKGLPDDKAVKYLLLDDLSWINSVYNARDDESADDLATARKWFYEAALRGRLLALYYVGDTLWREKGGAVDLGWIEQEEFDALTAYEKNALLPPTVYNALALEVAPELQDGAVGELLFELLPRTDRQHRIVEGLLAEFYDRLDASGLPPIVVPESTGPSIDELKSLLCESGSGSVEGN